MFRVLESEVGVDQLAFLGSYESVRADEMNLWVGPKDIGHNPGAVLVGIYFWEKPLW